MQAHILATILKMVAKNLTDRAEEIEEKGDFDYPDGRTKFKNDITLCKNLLGAMKESV